MPKGILAAAVLAMMSTTAAAGPLTLDPQQMDRVTAAGGSVVFGFPRWSQTAAKIWDLRSLLVHLKSELGEKGPPKVIRFGDKLAFKISTRHGPVAIAVIAFGGGGGAKAAAKGQEVQVYARVSGAAGG